MAVWFTWLRCVSVSSVGDVIDDLMEPADKDDLLQGLVSYIETH